MNAPQPCIWTIGHSNHPVKTFMDLLASARIEAVADVRSSPFSRFAPQFNRETLAASLRERGVQYVFLGHQLGARSDDPSCFVDGRVQYSRLASTAPFQKGLDRVLRGAAKYRLALLCAEKDPLDCHRAILVAKELVARGARVEHILADGSLEPHGDAMLRLLDVLGLPRQDLFHTQDQMIAEGLLRQESRIAYVDEEQSVEATRRPA